MLKIAVGDKNRSSWSMRPWLVLRHLGVPFEEQVVRLDRPTTAREIRKVSPSGRVPCLVDGDLAVWDSLSICEVLAEKFPDRGLWPEDAKARAVARSVCAEMHSGFAELRKGLSMRIAETVSGVALLHCRRLLRSGRGPLPHLRRRPEGRRRRVRRRRLERAGGAGVGGGRASGDCRLSVHSSTS